MAAVQRYTVTVPPFVARAAYDPRNGDKPNQILIHTGEGDPIDLSGPPPRRGKRQRDPTGRW
ncbi:hypothetical protein, partial [Streptomyces rhizosphaericus]|uniref:hypothetical protein n=1 Tax=Streptomyces rhizosphaericus TaxID=114699 RepID=UPI0031CE38C8